MSYGGPEANFAVYFPPENLSGRRFALAFLPESLFCRTSCSTDTTQPVVSHPQSRKTSGSKVATLTKHRLFFLPTDWSDHVSQTQRYLVLNNDTYGFADWVRSTLSLKDDVVPAAPTDEEAPLGWQREVTETVIAEGQSLLSKARLTQRKYNGAS